MTDWTLPGPAPAPIVGAAGNLLRFVGDPIAYLNKHFPQYGRIISIVNGANVRFMTASDQPAMGIVCVYGAELTREVETQHEVYYKSALTGGLYPVGNELTARQQALQRFGTGLFHVNSDVHRQHRRLLMPAFHKKRIESYHSAMQALTEETLAAWQPGQAIDLHREMMTLTLRIATQTLFGVDIHKENGEIGMYLNEALELLNSPRTAIDPRDIPGTYYSRLLDLVNTLDDKMHSLIARKRADVAAGIDAGDVLSMLIAARDEDGTTLTEAEIIGHAGVTFAAGHETTSNALTWTLFLLSQHPEVAADLLDELQGVLHGAAPTLEQLAQLPFLDSVVKESLRIIPPVPLNHRIIHANTEIGGHAVPAGAEMFVSIYHTHHDPELYPEPNRFNPYRWATIAPDAFEFNPFSAGPRMCIGAPFALQEMKLVLSLILQHFRLEFTGERKIDRRMATTLSPKQGMPMRINAQDREFGRGVGLVQGNIRECVDLA
jgi:cytochrome P450